MIFTKFFIPLSIHPLFPATILFMFGIWFQSLGYSFYLLFGLWTLNILIAWFSRSLYPLLFATCILVGAALYQQTINRFTIFHDEICNTSLDITLTITDISSCDHRYLKHRISGKIEQLMNNNHVINHGNQTILWYTQKKHAITIADKIKFSGIKINYPKQESMRNYFFKQNIAGTIISNTYKFVNRPTFSFFRWLFEYRLHILNNLKQKLSKKAFLFISLLFFGNKEGNKKQLLPLQQDCKRWGISHYLARSGLHLIIFIILWEFLLKLLPLSFNAKNIIMCLITLIYVLFSWTSVSFARSFAGFMFYKMSTLFYQQVHPIHLITIITFCALIINPLYLFFLDFQLSFGITFLLTWANYITMQRTLIIPKNS